MTSTSDWKYLNDPNARGLPSGAGSGKVNGLLVPIFYICIRPNFERTLSVHSSMFVAELQKLKTDDTRLITGSNEAMTSDLIYK